MRGPGPSPSNTACGLRRWWWRRWYRPNSTWWRALKRPRAERAVSGPRGRADAVGACTGRGDLGAGRVDGRAAPATLDDDRDPLGVRRADATGAARWERA